MARQVPISTTATPEQMVALALGVNAALGGETTNTDKISVSAGTFTVEDSRCRVGRFAFLIPLDNIAASMAWYLNSMKKGEMSFTVAGTGTGTFAWVIVGGGEYESIR